MKSEDQEKQQLIKKDLEENKSGEKNQQGEIVQQTKSLDNNQRKEESINRYLANLPFIICGETVWIVFVIIFYMLEPSEQCGVLKTWFGIYIVYQIVNIMGLGILFCMKQKLSNNNDQTCLQIYIFVSSLIHTILYFGICVSYFKFETCSYLDVLAIVFFIIAFFQLCGYCCLGIIFCGALFGSALQESASSTNRQNNNNNQNSINNNPNNLNNQNN